MSTFLPMLMALMMFTMGLSLVKQDLTRIVQAPKPIIIGLLCQLTLLPVIGFFVASSFQLEPHLLIGFMILCACPGGIMSNYISFTAKGDMALSISLTLVSSIICVFSIPIIINLTQAAIGSTPDQIKLPLLDTMSTIAWLTLVPIAVGMLVKHRFPQLGKKLCERLTTVCSLLLISYVLYLWYLQYDAITAAFSTVGLPVLLLILLTSSAAWAIGLFSRLGYSQRVTLVIETSIQNSALAFTVSAVIMNAPQYAIPTVFYTVAMFIPAIILIVAGRRKSVATPVSD